MEPIRKEDALDYHEKGKPGKIEVIPTKPTHNQRDLALAYSPGVAEPCKEIVANPEAIYKYTAKGNLVAVISNGTAVLGLGNLGPAASKPVMEGKGVLFKVFADIDVFDLELNTVNVDEFVKTVKCLEPTFGGINLEDIKAPESFEIERRLKEQMNIPVMHDDQHGTAIITGAALINALEVAEKKISDVKVVMSGAGASALACAKLIISLGVKKENIVMIDRKGVLGKDRDDLDKYKSQFVTERNVHSLEEAMKGADVFIGLSAGGLVSPEMLKGMAENPIVFAMANPVPEIEYPVAVKTRGDIIMATGRSDFPNQVNNVLGFPFIFRGALDVRATQINEDMKVAAVKAIADLAKKPVPEIVTMAYDQANLKFGREYIIPKPLDPRLITNIAPAVAKAAMSSGVAKNKIIDWEAYKLELLKRLGMDNQITRVIINRAKKHPKRVVFTEAENPKILKAISIARDDGYVEPILLGQVGKIKEVIKENDLDLGNCEIIDPYNSDKRSNEFGQIFFDKRKRKGITLNEASKLMHTRTYFGAMMVEVGEADAMLSGLTRRYSDFIRPALQIFGKEDEADRIIGMYILITRKGPLFFADATVNENPNVDELVSITELVNRSVNQYNIKPRIALLSYSNFGSSKGEVPDKMSKAVEILKERNPDMIVDGEVQANIGLNDELLKEFFPFSELTAGGANTLIFPNLSSGNISYKIVQEVCNAEAIGPILLGLKKSFHVLQMGSTVREIVNMIAIAVMDAHFKSLKK